MTGPNVWSSGVPITYNIPNGLAVGEYTYTITFIDDYNNNITDTITVTVKSTSSDGETISIGNYYLIFLVIGIISLTIVQKRRKLSSNN